MKDSENYKRGSGGRARYKTAVDRVYLPRSQKEYLRIYNWIWNAQDIQETQNMSIFFITALALLVILLSFNYSSEYSSELPNQRNVFSCYYLLAR